MMSKVGLQVKLVRLRAAFESINYGRDEASEDVLSAKEFLPSIFCAAVSREWSIPATVFKSNVPPNLILPLS